MKRIIINLAVFLPLILVIIFIILFLSALIPFLIPFPLLLILAIWTKSRWLRVPVLLGESILSAIFLFVAVIGGALDSTDKGVNDDISIILLVLVTHLIVLHFYYKIYEKKG